MTDERPTLRLGWWNTGVAPPYVPSKATKEHRAAVTEVLGQLIAGPACTLLGLAEVRQEPILDWVPENVRQHWREIRDTSGDRNDFDIGLLYDDRYLRHLETFWARDWYGGSPIRAGLILTFETRTSEAACKLLVALAHWRSDAGNHSDGEARRSRAAEYLRKEIARSADALGGRPSIIVLGDFNAEPFSTPLVESLGSTRSRDVVRKHAREPNSADLLLYNPTWRLLGEQHPWRGIDAPTLAGTYRKKNDSTPHAWRTIDQMLVSGDLLGTSGWTLREDAVTTWASDAIFDPHGSRPHTPFDHLPLVATLEWLAATNDHGSRNP